MNIPVIRLEIQNMKYAIQTALTQHAAQMDADIQAAVESYCTAENISRVVREAARSALQEAIRSEVDKFFRYGNGREAVAAAVKESILKNQTYTPIDNFDGAAT
jgi:SpoVK/Ycf46/Vps4 family AAA+-type ATPase